MIDFGKLLSVAMNLIMSIIKTQDTNPKNIMLLSELFAIIEHIGKIKKINDTKEEDLNTDIMETNDKYTHVINHTKILIELTKKDS